MSKVKITSFEVENVKRVKAVHVVPTDNGLTILGGNNNQGKTSVLDAIAWALGGNRLKPSNPQRKGSMSDPQLKITLSNGLVAERKGKNSDLHVTDPTGKKSGQGLLDSFIEELALNLPKFMNQTSKEKAKTLLQLIGVGDQLEVLENKETRTVDLRLAKGQEERKKQAYADELEFYENMPEDLLSVGELISQQQEILARNGENQRKRQNYEFIKASHANEVAKLDDMRLRLLEQEEKVKASAKDLSDASKSALDLHDESTVELEQSIRNVEETNRKIRANKDKERAQDEAKQLKAEYAALQQEIESIRSQKVALLEGADLPLEGLSVQDGELTYNGFKWDGMSGSQQLKVSVAIVRALNPNCGFVLLDKLEQFDSQQLGEFGTWLESEGLQAIATRVGTTGGNNEIIIEDGYVLGHEDVLLTEETVKVEVDKKVVTSWD